MLVEREQQSGCTRTDLVVVTCVLIIATVAVLPGIIRSRGEARRMTCGNNLKQITLGLRNYHDVYKEYPPLSTGPTGPLNNAANIASGNPQPQIGIHVHLRVFTHKMIDYVPWGERAPTSHDGRPWPVANLDPDNTWWENMGNARRYDPSFFCPVGPRLPAKGFARNSYHFSTGTIGTYTPDLVPEGVDPAIHNNQWGQLNDGLFTAELGRRQNDVVDGSSNTIMVGEVVMFNPNNREVRGNVAKWPESVTATAAHAGNEYEYQTCLATLGPRSDRYRRGVPIVSATADTSPGRRWHDGAVYFTGMTTAFAPNGPSCTDAIRGRAAYITPSSFHPGGALLAMADGAVHFVSENTDVEVMRALGTIAGGERRVDFGSE